MTLSEVVMQLRGDETISIAPFDCGRIVVTIGTRDRFARGVVGHTEISVAKFDYVGAVAERLLKQVRNGTM